MSCCVCRNKQWGFLDLSSPVNARYLQTVALKQTSSGRAGQVEGAAAEEAANSIVQQWTGAITTLRQWILSEVVAFISAKVVECCDAASELSLACGAHSVCTTTLCSRLHADAGSTFSVKDEIADLLFESSWVNVNRQHDANLQHNHGAVTLSGVFYIDGGYPLPLENENENDEAGVGVGVGIDSTTTQLRVYPPPIDAPYPRHVCDGEDDDASAQPTVDGSHPGKNQTTVPVPGVAVPIPIPIPTSGRAGTLLLWPGYIDHDVEPHTRPEPRISAAFNMWVRMRTD